MEDNNISIIENDPIKEKAGQALAEKDAEARKIKKPTKSDGMSDSRSRVFTFTDGFNKIQQFAGLVGATFTIYHGYKFISSWSDIKKKELRIPEESPKLRIPDDANIEPQQPKSVISQPPKNRMME